MGKVNRIIISLLITLLVLPISVNADRHEIGSDICAEKLVYLDEQDEGTIVCDNEFKKGTEFNLSLTIYTSDCDSTIEAYIEYDPKYLEIVSSEKSKYVLDIEKNDEIVQGRLNHKYTYNVCSSEYIPSLENIKFKIINDDVDSTVIKVNDGGIYYTTGKPRIVEHKINIKKIGEETISSTDKDETTITSENNNEVTTSENNEILNNDIVTSQENITTNNNNSDSNNTIIIYISLGINFLLLITLIIVILKKNK